MKLITPEIVWHNKEPVLSAHFHRNGPLWRLATGGADNDVKMWKVTTEGEKLRMLFVSSLPRHTKAVNVVRFSPNGDFLASAGDDSVICLWRLSDGSPVSGNLVSSETAANKETWSVVKTLRGHLEDIYDLCWSPDSNFIVSGSVDNTAVVWDVQKGQLLATLKEPRQYVQGVAWDPLGKYIATMSCDRNLRIYTTGQKFKCIHTVSKLATQDQDGGSKQIKMWMDESLNSFFRRLAFTPDGSFLITPGGTHEVGDKQKNSTYIFTRNNLTKPVLQLPGPEKPTVCARCSPVLYELLSQTEDSPSLTSLPYRMVYAVASIDSILLYDTQHSAPFAYVSNIHYAAITDMAWSNDGQTLVISSSDCYCSILTFEPGELGTPLSDDKMPPALKQAKLSTVTQSESPVHKKKSSTEQSTVPSQNGERKNSVSEPSTGPSRVSHSPSPRPTSTEPPAGRRNSSSSSPENKPRRIRPTIIATFTSPKQATSSRGSQSPTGSQPTSQDTQKPSSPVSADSQTQDKNNSSQVVSPTSHNHSSQDTSSTKPVLQNGSTTSSATSATNKTSSSGGPRRVNFITLSSFSNSQSNNSKDLSVKNSTSKESQDQDKQDPDGDVKGRSTEEPMEV